MSGGAGQVRPAPWEKESEDSTMQIRGTWDTGQVWIDDRELSPERSQAS
jgi:hypothetical protein